MVLFGLRLAETARRAGLALGILAVAAIATSAAPAAAQSPGESACAAGGARSAPAMTHRHALLIANSEYSQEIGPLEVTLEDAERMCAALEALGFNVALETNLDLVGMKKAVKAYSEALDASGDEAVGFFYFSGHGAQQEEDGDNYLIPIEEEIKSSEDLSFYAYRLGQMVREIAGADFNRGRANFIVIDACRNVAFERTRNIRSRGFAPVRQRGGVLIAFSTEPGDVALDAPHFSTALARELQAPNQPAYAAFRAVRRSVYAATEGDQRPWFEDGLIDDFYFKRGAVVPTPGGPPVAESERLRPAPPPLPKPMSAGRETLRLSRCPQCPEMMVIAEEDPSVDGVTVSGEFAISLREVTFNDWRACVDAGRCREYQPDDAGWGLGDRPVINVSYEDAQGYVAWLRDETQRPFRLPADGEWTKAAAAGSEGRFAHGDDASQLCLYANGATHRLFGGMSCADPRRARTTSVARYAPNAFGLYDTAGNVWEWVSGCADGSDQESCARVLRGGSWESGVGALTPMSRRLAVQSYRSPTAGFRVAMDWPLDQ